MKICLDAGHYGKYNQSTCNKNYYESDITWKLHNYLKSELEAKGFEVITTRTAQASDLALEARGKKSKDCKLFLSLHSNASNNTSANNSWACCLINDNSTNIDEISVDLGKKLADKVTELMTSKQNGGYIYRRIGSNGSDYYGVLRGAKSVGTPAILLEHGFHTNAQNTEFLLNDENLKGIAVAEAEIIADYFNVSSSSATTSSSSVLPYKVKILDDCFNIRSDAGVTNKKVGTITDNGTYTIIEEKSVGSVTWGKLKSGAGWISLHEKYVSKI